MAKITKIEPALLPRPALVRVAAYARVSERSERLEHSFAAQVSYYSRLIQGTPGWSYAGVYSDEGISGTGTSRRAGFRRLMADCEAGLIDVILVKSISRFARNTVDLLNAVRRLKELRVGVRFEKERIDSLSSEGEVMLTLLASFAQSESESMSGNVKWGIRRKMQAGLPISHFRVYGYRWEGDTLVPVPGEAAIVKRIFQNFIDGRSRRDTVRELEAEGLRTRSGRPWTAIVTKALTNVTYTGNLLFQKEYSSDPLTKRHLKNRGELPRYFVENTHEAIIDPAVFAYVQDEIKRRRELRLFPNKNLNAAGFTGKIKCPHCGCGYVHHISRKGKYVYAYWICARKKDGTGCPTKGYISHRGLLRVCAELAGPGEFDEESFLSSVDRIEVPGEHTLEFFMKDGATVRRSVPRRSEYVKRGESIGAE